jgi:hypothetical protein
MNTFYEPSADQGISGKLPNTVYLEISLINDKFKV